MFIFFRRRKRRGREQEERRVLHSAVRGRSWQVQTRRRGMVGFQQDSTVRKVLEVRNVSCNFHESGSQEVCGLLKPYTDMVQQARHQAYFSSFSSRISVAVASSILSRPSRKF